MHGSEGRNSKMCFYMHNLQPSGKGDLCCLVTVVGMSYLTTSRCGLATFEFSYTEI